MKKFLLITLALILLAGCGPSEADIQKAIEETQAAAPIPTPTLSDLFKTQGLKFIEEASSLKSMTKQGVNFLTYSSQLSEVHGVYEILSSLWVDGLEPEAKENVQLALEGWDCALLLWDLKINHKYAVVEYGSTKEYFEKIYSYGGDNLVTVYSGHIEYDEVLGEDRNMKKLPYDENISILFALASDYFEKAQPPLLDIIQ